MKIYKASNEAKRRVRDMINRRFSKAYLRGDEWTYIAIPFAVSDHEIYSNGRYYIAFACLSSSWNPWTIIFFTEDDLPQAAKKLPMFHEEEIRYMETFMHDEEGNWLEGYEP